MIWYSAYCCVRKNTFESQTKIQKNVAAKIIKNTQKKFEIERQKRNKKK